MELDDSDELEVNQILNSRFDHHCKGSGLLYLVKLKWFDNTSGAMSWEPPKHLVNAPDMIQVFHQAYPVQLAP